MTTSELPGIITCVEIYIQDVSPGKEYNLVDPLPETATLEGESLTPKKIQNAMINFERKIETTEENDIRYQTVVKFTMNTGASINFSFLKEARMIVSTCGKEM